MHLSSLLILCNPVLTGTGLQEPFIAMFLKSKEKENSSVSKDKMKARTRTPEEIRATYRKAGNAASAAAFARNKLVERQEKLEKISKDADELESHSADYASLASELTKRMQTRKWWQL